MSIRQRLSVTTDGRQVVVKQAPPGPLARRLAEEAAVLRRAAHPGVVEVVAERSLDDGGHELMVGLVGDTARTVADLIDDGTGLAGAAGLVASVATTVADLHDVGVGHTRISAEHVLLDDRDRPVLCGFGDAVAAGAGPAPVALQAVDVAGLGVLLRRLVTSAAGDPGEVEPIPSRRFSPAGRADRWQVYARRSLLNVADRATADDPAARPSARTLVADVLAALPEARLPGAAGPSDGAPLSSRAPRSGRSRWSGVAAEAARLAMRLAARVPWAPLAGAAGLGLLVFGIQGVLAVPDGVDGPVGADATPTSLEVEQPVPPPDAADTSPAATSPAATSPAVTTTSAAAPVAPAFDGIVEVGGVRYSVGRPGDLVAVGDWDCDGEATVGLVDHRSGHVFLFDRWAGAGAEVSMPAAAVVEEPASVEVVHRDGCDVLVVAPASGSRVEVVP